MFRFCRTMANQHSESDDDWFEQGQRIPSTDEESESSMTSDDRSALTQTRNENYVSDTSQPLDLSDGSGYQYECNICRRSWCFLRVLPSIHGNSTECSWSWSLPTTVTANSEPHNPKPIELPDNPAQTPEEKVTSWLNTLPENMQSLHPEF